MYHEDIVYLVYLVYIAFNGYTVYRANSADNVFIGYCEYVLRKSYIIYYVHNEYTAQLFVFVLPIAYPTWGGDFNQLG